MQLVPSITRYTCTLACLESYSRDIGLFLTQADLMKYHPLLCLDPAKNHEFGATSPSQFLQLCISLALNPQSQRNFDFAQIEPTLRGIGANQAVMFSVIDYNKSGCSHMVRFESIVAGERLRAMCPYFGLARLEEIEWKDLVAGDVTMILLTRNPL